MADRRRASDVPEAPANSHAAYAAYRAGEISRAAWSGIMLAEFNTEPIEPESES